MRKKEPKTAVEYDVPLSYKIKVWGYRNFHMILIITAVNVIFGFFVIFVSFWFKSSELKALTRSIEALSNKVVVVSADGKVVEVQKAKVSPEILKMAIRNVIDTYLTVDVLWFTNGSYEMRNYPPEISGRNFDISKVVKLKAALDDVIDDAGLPSFYSLIKYLHSMGLQGRLPFSLKVVSYNDKVVPSLTNNVYQNFQVYEYSGTGDAIALFYDKKTGSFITTNSKIRVLLEFYTNPLEGNVNNPMGIKIIRIRASWAILGEETNDKDFTRAE